MPIVRVKAKKQEDYIGAISTGYLVLMSQHVYMKYSTTKPLHSHHGTTNAIPDPSLQTNHQLLLAEEQMVQLVQGLSERQLLHCVNMIVLSDHGMAAAGKDRVIGLQKYVPELNDVALTYFGAVGMFSLKEDNDGTKADP